MRRLLDFFGLDPGRTDQDFFRDGPASPSTLGGGITIKGELRGEGPLTVLDGTLHVGPEARVDANITARAIVIAGVVRGNLSADTRVEIPPTGALTGTVKSGSFTAADGARVKGEIWVEQPVEDRRFPAVRA